METQRNKRISSSFAVRVPDNSEHGFLRFTRQLNQYHNAEHLLQALPSTLQGLISANTCVVMHANGSHPAFRFIVDSKRSEFNPLPSLASEIPSAYPWVHEHQKPLVVRSVAEETRFPDTLQ